MTNHDAAAAFGWQGPLDHEGDCPAVWPPDGPGMKLYCSLDTGHPRKHEAWVTSPRGPELVRAWDDSDIYQREGEFTAYWTPEDAEFADRLDARLSTADWTPEDAAYIANAIHLAVSARARPGGGSHRRLAAFVEMVYPGDQLNARLKQALENPLFRAEWQKLTS
jgi:hypothetical protein